MRTFLAILISAGLTGCVSYPASVDTDGIYNNSNPAFSPQMLASLKALRGKSAQIENFRMESGLVPHAKCAALLASNVSLLPPKGKSFEQYIHDAFVDEISLVNAAAPESERKISGTVNEIALIDSPVSGMCLWKIGYKLSSSNGRSLQINEQSPIRILEGQRPTIPQVVNTLVGHFESAVNKVMIKTITHPEFLRLFDSK